MNSGESRAPSLREGERHSGRYHHKKVRESPPHDFHLQNWRCQWFAPMGTFKGTWGSLEKARSEPLGGDNFWEPMPEPETGSSKTKCCHEPTVREQWADEGASERKEKAGDWEQRVRRTGWQKKILAWPRLSHGHIKDNGDVGNVNDTEATGVPIDSAQTNPLLAIIAFLLRNRQKAHQELGQRVKCSPAVWEFWAREALTSKVESTEGVHRGVIIL